LKAAQFDENVKPKFRNKSIWSNI